MQVILSEDVKVLGKSGSIVNVKDGYARNFLLPQKLAFAATEGNIKRVEQQKKRKELELAEEKKQAEKLAEKLSKVSLTISVEVNDLEKLYGSISEQDIAKALKAEGHAFEHSDIVLEKSIEELGIFEVGVKVHPQVIAKVRLWVTKK